MNPFSVKLELPDVANNALNPVAGKAGETLCDVWELVFGGFGNFVGKVKFKRDLNLEKFKSEIINEVNSIPEENLVEPPLSVIGPALDASKYYFDENTIRTMFAKLISKAMDKDYKDEILNAYTEIIKQLSSIDASILSDLNACGANSPVCNFSRQEDNGSYVIMHTYVYLRENQSDEQYILENSRSLVNLSRLGLIQVSFVTKMHHDEVYDKYKNLSISTFQNSTTLPDGTTEITTITYDMERGFVRLTPLGESFVKVCLI